MNVSYICRLTRDPEAPKTVKTPRGDTLVTHLSVAENTYYGGQQRTEYSRVTVWGKHAENCAKYLKKGSQVQIIGDAKPNSYTNREGQIVNTLEVRANRVQFLGSPTGNAKAEPSAEPTYEEATAEIDEAGAPDDHSDGLPW